MIAEIVSQAYDAVGRQVSSRFTLRFPQAMVSTVRGVGRKNRQ
jgi:hypothetical protein